MTQDIGIVVDPQRLSAHLEEIRSAVEAAGFLVDAGTTRRRTGGKP